jgi:pimeloyl-ACP methyl ester carboxylesterase
MRIAASARSFWAVPRWIPPLVILLNTLGCANRAFYWSSRGAPQPPNDGSFTVQSVKIPVAGTSLAGWVLEPDSVEPIGTVVFLHGNGGRLDDHVGYVKFLPGYGFRVLMFDYRGYGANSMERVTRASTAADALAAVDYATERWGVPWLMGHSLGASLAIVTGGARPHGVRGVIAVAPFSSYREMAQEWLGQKHVFRPLIGPSSMLVSTGDDPIDAVASIAPTPLLLVHGSDDELIPPRMSRALYETANEPKELLILSGVHHLSDCQSMGPEYVSTVVRFLTHGQ